MDKAWCIPFKAEGESKKVKNKKVNSTSRGDGACIDCGAVQVMHCWWCALYWSIFFNDARRQYCQVGEIWIKGWRGGWWGGEGGWWHLIQSLHSRGDDFKVGALSVTHWWSKSLRDALFLSSMMQQCRQWKGCIGALGVMHVSWIIDALRPGSPMISDHLQYNMRSSTIWGQLKGQHLNQLQHSGWVKISKLAVLCLWMWSAQSRNIALEPIDLVIRWDDQWIRYKSS